MLGARARLATRSDLASIRDIPLYGIHLLVANGAALVAEAAGATTAGTSATTTIEPASPRRSRVSI
jgi:hypothetical protein